MKRASLGRNLSALLGETAALSNSLRPAQTVKLPLNNIQPGKYQPRQRMNDDGLAELSASIKQQGLLQPIIVRPIGPQRYEIIAGERRWRACQLAGLTEISTVIREVDDEAAIAIGLVENLQRENLNALDEARSIQRLIQDFHLTHQQIADLLSRSRTAVSNALRLLQLSSEVSHLLEEGKIEMGHARALLSLTPTQQIQAAQIIIAKHLTVRDTEKLVSRMQDLTSSSKTPELSALSSPFEEELNHLALQLKTKVKIQKGSQGKGKLLIHYHSSDELERLIKRLSQV